MSDLKSRRKQRRLTLRDMSEATGIKFTRYTAIEGRHVTPSDDEYLAIERALADTWGAMFEAAKQREVKE